MLPQLLAAAAAVQGDVTPQLQTAAAEAAEVGAAAQQLSLSSPNSDQQRPGRSVLLRPAVVPSQVSQTATQEQLGTRPTLGLGFVLLVEAAVSVGHQQLRLAVLVERVRFLAVLDLVVE
jgi:hypothetical protein